MRAALNVGFSDDVEAAVAVEQRRVVAVELQALAVHEEHRDLGAVLARIEHLLRLEGRRVVARHLGRAEHAARFRRDVVAIDRGRHAERVERVEHERRVVGSGEAVRRARPRKRDLVLEPAVERVHVDSARHVLQIRREQLAARGGRALERLGALGEHGAPVRLRGILRIDQHHAPVRRSVIGRDEQLVADVVDDVVRIVADLGDHGCEIARAGREVAHVERVAVLAFAALRHVENGEALVLGRVDNVEALRIGRVLEDERVGCLPRAELVEEHLMILVDRRLLVPRGRLGVAAVVETRRRATRRPTPSPNRSCPGACASTRAPSPCIAASRSRSAMCRRPRTSRPSTARTRRAARCRRPTTRSGRSAPRPARRGPSGRYSTLWF